MTQYNFESTFAGKSNFLSDAKFSGGLNLESSANVQEIFEKVCVYKDTVYDELVIDLGKGSLHNYIEQSTGNFTFNITGLRGIPKEKSIVVTILINMGSTAYAISNPTTTGFKIDDQAVAVKWINSTSPTSGFINAVNVYTFAIIKNDMSDYTVLGTLSSFGGV
jgi:hypothetical protein